MDGRIQRLFLNVGEMDGVTKKDFVKFMTRALNIPASAIGTITLKKSFLHFDLDAAFADRARRELPSFTINNRRLRLDDATPKQDRHVKEERIFEKWDKTGKRKK